jgi:hypothetical protein
LVTSLFFRRRFLLLQRFAVPAHIAELTAQGTDVFLRLLRASQPWGGHYELTPSLWATAHTTQFTQRSGWRYLVQGAGAGALQGGGTYVTLVDALGNVTIVIEAAGGQGLSAWSSANCNAYQGLGYSPALGAQNATFVLSSGGSSALPPSLWP